MSDTYIASAFYESAIHRFKSHKDLAEKAIAQLDDAQLLWRANEECNSVAVIVQHMHGNMISRWTNFLTTDGEKPTRKRDREFEPYADLNRADVIQLWEEGWDRVISAIEGLAPGDILRTIKIRGQELSVMDAIHRQLAHYAYHVGQIVQIAKELKGMEWESLSIPRGKSAEYEPTKKD